MRSLPRCTTVGCSEKSILLFSPYFTTLSVVVRVCIRKPVNKGFSADFAKWNISDASVGTEELAHLEMVSTIVHQLTRDLSMEEIEKSGFGPYYIDHGNGIWPQAAGGIPFNACEFQSKGDPVTDLFEDLAAEQKARATYDNILRVVRDIPEIADPIRFLRAREVVHFQRFGEANREDCSKIPKARKAHKFSTFGKSLSIRTFAGHRHEPPYLLLYLKMKIIHEIGQAAFSYN